MIQLPECVSGVCHACQLPLSSSSFVMSELQPALNFHSEEREEAGRSSYSLFLPFFFYGIMPDCITDRRQPLVKVNAAFQWSMTAFFGKLADRNGTWSNLSVQHSCYWTNSRHLSNGSQTVCCTLWSTKGVIEVPAVVSWQPANRTIISSSVNDFSY